MINPLLVVIDNFPKLIIPFKFNFNFGFLTNRVRGISKVIARSTFANQDVTWSVISGTGGATISETGLLRAVYNGTVIVRATANDGSGVYGEKVITISRQTGQLEWVRITGENGQTTITTEKGTLQMYAEVLPEPIEPSLLSVSDLSVFSASGSDIINPEEHRLQMFANTQSVVWSVIPITGNASISSTSGLLQAIYDGTVIVRATINDGSGRYGEKVITISGQSRIPFPVTHIIVTGENNATTIMVNNGTLQMYASVFPRNALFGLEAYPTPSSLYSYAKPEFSFGFTSTSDDESIEMKGSGESNLFSTEFSLSSSSYIKENSLSETDFGVWVGLGEPFSQRLIRYWDSYILEDMDDLKLEELEGYSGGEPVFQVVVRKLFYWDDFELDEVDSMYLENIDWSEITT